MSDIVKGITDCLDTINKLRDENTAQAARIAELEAALRDVLPYVDTCNSSHREAQEKGYAALEGGEMSDDPYKSFDHHIKAQEAEITRLRAAINDALTAPWPDPELNSTWRQEPIGPNETPEEAIKRLVSVRAEWAVYKNNCENPVIAELRAALEGGKDEMVERVPGSNTSALG